MAAVVRGGPTSRPKPRAKAQGASKPRASKSPGYTPAKLGAAHKVGLPQAINERLHLLKIHLPYHESDHVLNIAYNALCHGTCLQDIDRRRGQ